MLSRLGVQVPLQPYSQEVPIPPSLHPLSGMAPCTCLCPGYQPLEGMAHFLPISRAPDNACIEKILSRCLLGKWLAGWMSLTTPVLPAWCLGNFIQCLLCARLYSRCLGYIKADKNLCFMERQYILVGVTGNKQYRLLINDMIYNKVIHAMGGQEKGDWECGVGASGNVK